MANAQTNDQPLEQFLSQSSELIEQLDAAMTEINPGSQDAEDERYCVAQILQSLQVIKGAAAFLQLTQVSNFAREAAGALDKLRHADAKAAVKLTTTMQDSVNALRDAIGLLETSGQEAPPDGEGPAILATQAAAAARAIQAAHVQFGKHDDTHAGAASRQQVFDRIKKDV